MSDNESGAMEVANEEPKTETEAVTEAKSVKTATEDEITETVEAADDAVEAEEIEPEPASDEDVMPDGDVDLLILVEDYLVAGVHTGT